jgi:hypothetical protein
VRTYLKNKIKNKGLGGIVQVVESVLKVKALGSPVAQNKLKNKGSWIPVTTWKVKIGRILV